MTTTATTASDVDRLPAPRRPRWWARRFPWWVETLVAVGFYEIYDGVQAATAGDADEALASGRTVIHAEQHLHLWVEPTLNRFATTHGWIGLFCGYYYELAHVLVTAAVLGFVWWRRPQIYARLRNVLLVLSLAALVVFWRYPVAPPRFVDHRLTDTLVSNDILGAAHVHGGLVNLYAAMPSLHVAWATWCAAAIVLATRSRWRHLSWLYPMLTAFAVMATANHYVLDVLAGAGLTAAAMAVMVAAVRRRAGQEATGRIRVSPPQQPA